MAIAGALFAFQAEVVKKEQIKKGGKTYERILVPLDGSKVGESALSHVKDLVSKMSPEVKVEITLLQALAPKTVPTVSGFETAGITYTEEQIEQTKKEAIEYLDKTGEALKSEGCPVVARVAN